MATATAPATSLGRIESLLGAEAQGLLEHRCTGVPKELLHLPGPDFVDRVVASSDRNVRVLRSLETLFEHGRLAGIITADDVITMLRHHN